MLRNLIISIIVLTLVIGTAFADESEGKDKDRIKFIGDLIIGVDEVVEGDVIVMQGDLTVKGSVKGDAVVSLGDAFVHSGGVVSGDLITWKGKIYIDPEGVVEGRSVEHRLFDIPLDKRNFRIGTSGGDDDRCEDKEGYKIEIDSDIGPRLSYNKVDGFFLGLEIPKVFRGNLIPGMSLHGYGGYGFSNDRWQYYTEVNKHFFEKNRLEIGLEGHSVTGTEDDWIIENWENSLAAFFLHEDFRDYYYRTGFGAHISQRLWSKLFLKVKFLNDEYDKTDNNTNWALFGGHKDFLPNFGFLRTGENISEGFMRSMIAEGSWDIFDGDLSLTGSAEYADYGLGGDFEFARYIFEVRGHFGVSDFEELAFRLKLGSSEDRLPPQKAFTLGGISTLRGFSHKEFYGDQMALLNLEYILFGRKHSRHFWLLKHIRVGLFTDIGSTHSQIFNDFDADYYKSDVGFVFMNDDGDIRLNIARRTDTGDKPWMVTFRITQPF